MSFQLTGWVIELLNVYGIPWPDVDEDAFHWVQQPLRDFGKDVVAVSDAIESAINDLQGGNPSQTLAAISRYCAEIRRGFLDPIQSVCDGLAGEPCDVAYTAVLDAKRACVAALLAEIGMDVVSVVETGLTFGAGALAAAAEDIALQKGVQFAIQAGEAEVVSQLQAAANRHLDNFVNSLINPFINSVERTVEGRLDSYLPQLALRDATVAAELGGSAAQTLRLDPEQLNHAVTRVWNSSQNLKQAASKLEGAIDQIFDKPDPVALQIVNLSSEMRIALKGAVKSVKSDLVSGIENLVHHVEKHFVTLLEDFVKSLEELDADARRAAATERMASAAGVAVLSAAGAWAGATGVVGSTSGRVDASEANRVGAVAGDGASLAQDVHKVEGLSKRHGWVVAPAVGLVPGASAVLSADSEARLGQDLGEHHYIAALQQGSSQVSGDLLDLAARTKNPELALGAVDLTLWSDVVVTASHDHLSTFTTWGGVLSTLHSGGLPAAEQILSGTVTTVGHQLGEMGANFAEQAWGAVGGLFG